jgi:hypothetical protein
MNTPPSFEVRLAQAIKSISEGREASFDPETEQYEKSFLDVQVELYIDHDVSFLATTLLVTSHNDAHVWADRVLKQHQINLDCEAAGYRLPLVEHMEPLPVDSNPFLSDQWSMGTTLVRGWTVMHPGFDNKDNPLPMTFIYLYNARTGQRIRVNLDSSKELSQS